MAIISEPAVQQAAQDVAAAPEDNRPAGEASLLSPVQCNGTQNVRRVTADSFRALSAKLKSAKARTPATAPEQAPDIAPSDHLAPAPEFEVAEAAQPLTDNPVESHIIADEPVPQPEIQQFEFLAPQSDEPQVEHPAPHAEVPQADYLAPPAEEAQTGYPATQVEVPQVDYLVPQPEQQPQYEPDTAAGAADPHSAGDPASLDWFVNDDLPCPPEMPDRGFLGFEEEVGEEAVQLEPAAEPVSDHQSRQVYRGLTAVDEEFAGSDQTVQTEWQPVDATEYQETPEFASIAQQNAIPDATTPIDEVAHTEFAESYEPEAAGQPGLLEPEAQPTEITAEPVEHQPDAPVIEQETQPQEAADGELQPAFPVDSETSEFVDTSEQPAGPFVEPALPGIETEVEAEAPPKPDSTDFTSAVDDTTVEEAEPVPCAAQDAPDVQDDLALPVQGENELPVPAEQPDPERPSEEVNETTAEPAPMEESLFNSALDEFKETNLSVEQLLAEVTGTPAPLAEVSDEPEPVEAAVGPEVAIDEASEADDATENEAAVEVQQPRDFEPKAPIEAKIKTDKVPEADTTAEIDAAGQTEEVAESESGSPIEAEASTEEAPEAVPIAESDSVAQTEVTSEGQSDTPIEAEAEEASESDADTPIQAEPEAEEASEIEAGATAGLEEAAEADTEAEVSAGAEIEQASESEVVAESDAPSESEEASQTESKSTTNVEAEAEADQASEAEHATESDAEAHSEIEAVTDTEEAAESETEAVTDTKAAESEAEAETADASSWLSGDKAVDDEFAAHKIDPQAGETARMLLDIMSKPSGAAQPQERALAADTLLRLVPKIPIANLIGLAERVCMMEKPPALLVNKMLKHPRHEVAGPLLEGCSGISDQVLLTVIASGDTDKQRMIARRRSLTPTMCDELLEHGDPSVYLTIVRNPGASISHASFMKLSDFAKDQAALQAPLVTRGDTPAPIAFELFWFLPSELRRYVLSRFLTDSETLDKILKITLAVDGADNSEDEPSEIKFADPAKMEELVDLIEKGEIDAATDLLARLAGINKTNAKRIICDSEGEPITVAMKAIGYSRNEYSAVVEKWRSPNSVIPESQRPTSELQNLFDSLSFNKARMLLTYWDWAADSSGPYALKAA